MTEKEVIRYIEANTPLRNKVHFKATAPDHWGNKRKFAFMFGYEQCDELFHIRDESISGRCYQYPGIEDLICDMLRKAGCKVVNVHLLTQVYEYMHRVVTIA